MDCKQKKQQILDYLNSKQSSQIEKDSIKVLWGRRPAPYGIKIYKKSTCISFN